MLSKKWRPFRQLSPKTSHVQFSPIVPLGQASRRSVLLDCPSGFPDRDRHWRRKGTKDGDDSAREAKLEWEGPKNRAQ